MSLGERHPDRLLRELSARQLAEWAAYATLEPFGSMADFWQAGLMASMLADVNRTKKSDKLYSPEDFMPKGMTAQSEADPDTMSRTITERFQALAELHKRQGHHGQ